MPRILRVINRLNLGGPASNVAYLTRYLSPEFEIKLVAGMIDETEASSEFILREMGLQPVYIPEMHRNIHALRDYRAYRRLKKMIRAYRPDIVHTHAAKAGALGRMAALACGVPVIVHTFHGHVFHSYFPPWKSNLFIGIERFLTKRSSQIVAISETQKLELGNTYRICPPDKITVVPLGLDLSRFRTHMDEKRRAWRKKYLVDEAEIVIAMVGRIVPVKNHRLFLEAIAMLPVSVRKKIRVFVVGDGEDRDKVRRHAEMLRLDHTDFTASPRKATITFTSWIREVDAVYAGAEIVALTSLNEGTPVSIIEALAASVPVVTTDVGGIRDFFADPDFGFIVPSGSVEALAAALHRLIEDPALRRQMQTTDRSDIINRFGYPRMIGDMKAMYHRLLHS